MMQDFSQKLVCLLFDEYRTLCRELVCMLLGLKPSGDHANDAFEKEVDSLSDLVDSCKREIDARQVKHVPDYDILYLSFLLNGGEIGVL